MSVEVETIVAISVMMAVFSAVAAIGTSIVLGAGFERLRSGFEVIRKQTGFFSDSIHKLEEKMSVVDEQTGKFSHALSVMEQKVTNVGEQTGSFTEAIQGLEEKVDVVNKQTGFFGDAIHKLEQKVDQVSTHEEILAEKIEKHADTDMISVGKTEALVSQAESLLNQMGAIADKMSEEKSSTTTQPEALLDFAHYTHMHGRDSQEHISYN